LIKNILTADVKKRFTAEQILSHPWMSGDKNSELVLDNVPK